MKRIFFSAAILLLNFACINAQAPDSSSWKTGGMGTLTFSEVGLFNWTAGGQSNLTLIGNGNIFANYAKGPITWDNSLDLAYGFIKNNFIFDPDYPFTKAEDKIDFNSKWGRKAWSDKFYYSALLNFRSQFSKGVATPGDSLYLSKFLAPAYLTLAVGLEYKPNEKMYFFLSPLAAKFTFVTDDSLAAAGTYGVNQTDSAGNALPGSSEKFRAELGAAFRFKFKADIMKNTGFETQLDLFSNYLDRPQNVDVRWTTALVAKVNAFLSVNFSTELIYDHDVKIQKVNSDGTPATHDDGSPRISPGTQFKQVFGLGVSYKF